jgi:hypothetical protein
VDFGYAFVVNAEIAVLIAANESQILVEIDGRTAIQGYQPGTHENPRQACSGKPEYTAIVNRRSGFHAGKLLRPGR